KISPKVFDQTLKSVEVCDLCTLDLPRPIYGEPEIRRLGLCEIKTHRHERQFLTPVLAGVAVTAVNAKLLIHSGRPEIRIDQANRFSYLMSQDLRNPGANKW